MMEDIREDVYVVGYWSTVGLVTDDREKAEKFLVRRRGDSPALPWAIRNIEDAVTHAYGTGLKDGEMN